MDVNRRVDRSVGKDATQVERAFRSHSMIVSLYESISKDRTFVGTLAFQHISAHGMRRKCLDCQKKRLAATVDRLPYVT